MKANRRCHTAATHRQSTTSRSHTTRRTRRTRAITLELLESRAMLTLLGQQLFPADNPWNQNIASAPVAVNSDAIINNIIAVDGNGHLHPDFGQDTHGANPLYGIPYNVVHGNTQPKVPVVIDAYASESDVQDAPIPANAVVEGDMQNGPTGGLANRGDSHLIVFDVDNDIVYEFYAASRPSENTDGKWHAAQESVWNLKTNTFRTLDYTSADAAGLPILPGLARPDEALPTSEGGQGAINHALRFTLKNNIILDQFLYPAEHVADPNNHNAAVEPPMGARFRLKANVDISQLNPESKIVAEALKTYGMIVADNGSNFFLSGASDSVDASNQDTLTWNDADIQDTVHGLKSLPFSDFEVVDLTPQVSGVSTANGAAGSTVTVSGQNFSGAAGHLQVLFGNTPATNVTVVDDGHVTATVPQGSGTVDVRVQSGVTTPSDTSNINNPIFGYGISPVSANDKFTYSSGGGGGNTAPVAQNDTASTNENTAVNINVLANDNDPDGDTLSVASVTEPGHGAAAINTDNTVKYTPSNGYTGSDTFNYTVSDGHGNTATASVSVTVNASGGTLTPQPTTITPTEGKTFTGAVGSFLGSASPSGLSHAATLGDLAATIDWGDGGSVTTGTVTTGAGGALVVGGSHVYADEATGLPITVTLSDLGITGTALSAANVSDAPLSAVASTIAPSAGASFTGAVATFTDANPAAAAGDFTATIVWGDGKSSSGSVSAATGGAFTVSGTHAFASAGIFPLDVQISDKGGAAATAAGHAVVGSAAVQGSGELLVDAVYQSLLGRTVDPNSLTYWTTQLAAGATRYDLAQTLIHSQEYLAGSVAAAYQQLLNRAADTQGLNYWIGRMNSGLTHSNLLAGIAASPEYSQRAGDNAAWLDAVYHDLLGRPVDPTGQTYWLGQITGGVPHYNVASRLLVGSEGQLKQIADAYTQYLGRTPDSGALAYWSSALDQGTSVNDIVASLVASQEFMKSATKSS